MSEYGFLFGFGLGWIPSAILAAIVGVLMALLWRYVLLFGGLLFLYVVTR